MDTFRRHSIYSALLARILERRCGLLHPERLFIARQPVAVGDAGLGRPSFMSPTCWPMIPASAAIAKRPPAPRSSISFAEALMGTLAAILGKASAQFVETTAALAA